jgi:hypothetical protein
VVFIDVQNVAGDKRMGTIEAKETVYQGTTFRSRLEARWAVVFDTLDVEWVYEPQEYELGLKHLWDEEDEEALQESLALAWDDEERDEIRREAWRKKHEQRLYVPDFWLPEFGCWVEIKGQLPTREEHIKAQKLASSTGEPVHLLWGNIPDPQAPVWGECTEVYLGEMNIIALLVLECGMEAVQRAFSAARHARFR